MTCEDPIIYLQMKYVAVNIASGGIVIAEARKRLCLPKLRSTNPKIKNQKNKQQNFRSNASTNQWFPTAEPAYFSRRSAVYFA